MLFRSNTMSLPDGLASITHWVGVHYLDEDSGEPIDSAEYEIHLDGGPMLSGKLNAQGQAEHQNIDDKRVKKVLYKPRKPSADKPHIPLDDLLG